MSTCSPLRTRRRSSVLIVSGLAALALVASACADDTGGQAGPAPSSSSSSATTVAGTTLTTVTTTTTQPTSTSVTTTTTQPTTTSVTTTTSAAVLDTSEACAVAKAWFTAAAARDSATAWDLIHPNSQTGPPLSAGSGGYQALTEPWLDELEMSWGPWAGASGFECSLYPFAKSHGDETGILAITGTVTIETTKALTVALPVRQHGGGWLIDPFYANALAQVVSPAAQNVALADVPVAASTAVVIDSTLISGPLESIIIVDGAAQPLIFQEHPTDFDLIRAEFVPSPSWSPGTHWVIAALMAENGIVSVAYDRFTVS